jgi:hypothetical protein
MSIHLSVFQMTQRLFTLQNGQVVAEAEDGSFDALRNVVSSSLIIQGNI